MRKSRETSATPAVVDAALAGLDFHQLDSFERFHLFTLESSSPKLSLAQYFSCPQLLYIPEQVENQLTVGICLPESGNSGLCEDLVLGHVGDFLGDIGVPDPGFRRLGIL